MSSCNLCSSPLRKEEIFYKEYRFCCLGCRTVYQILEAKNALDRKEQEPVYLEAKKNGLLASSIIESPLSSDEGKKWVITICNLWCSACCILLTLVLKRKQGVLDCKVDYMTDIATIQYDPCRIDRKEIQKTIENLGYQCQEFIDPTQVKVNRDLLIKATVGAFASLNVMMFAYPLYATYFDFDLENLKPVLAYVSLALTLPVMLYTGSPIYRRMWLQATHGVLAMETLIGVGTLAAFILSLWEMYKGTYHIYFDTIVVLLTFLVIGKILETRAKFSSKEALLRVQYTLPKKARKKMSDGSSSFVLLKEVMIGDTLIALQGEQVVMDGIVKEGGGYCDESHLTGELLPTSKRGESIVLAGSIVKEGTFLYQVTALSSHSSLAMIVNMIEKGLMQKTASTTQVEKILQFFIPVVFFLSFTVFLFFPFDSALNKALSILLISCPCAIGIAVPLVEIRLLHRFSDKGMLIRNRNLFYLFPQITHFIFDKTGTLTKGEFTVYEGIEVLDAFQKSILKGLSIRSTHPLSRALNISITESPLQMEQVKEIPGYGIQGEFKSHLYALGSHQLALSKGFAPTCGAETMAYFMSEEGILASLKFKDTLKAEAQEVIEKLKSFQVILLSGDQKAVVKAVAEQLKIPFWRGEATPIHKQQYLQELRDSGAKICMIGDGINDAPALSLADISISVASATEISKHVSDLVITKDQITTIVEGQELSRKGFRLIKQNLFWAFAYNIIGLFLAFIGLLTPLFASLAMILSSLIVHLNAKRL